MKKHFEKWLIKKLLQNSSLSESNINTERKTINLGLWAMARHFFEPHHNLMLYMLVKWYGYKCYQEEFVITSSWCNMNVDNVNERFFKFNDEFNQRAKDKFKKI